MATKKIVDLKKLEFHELALMFPKLRGEEREALKRDIDAKGVLMPVIMFEDKVLDGRNRVEIAIECDKEVEFVEWQGTRDEALAHVISLNAKRRQLTSGQKACVAVNAGRMNKLYEEKKEKKEKGEAVEEGDIADRLAEELTTNRTYIFKAQAIYDKSKRVFGKVLDGQLTIPQAERELREKRTASTNGEAATGSTETEGTHEAAEPEVLDQQDKAVPVKLRPVFSEVEKYKNTISLLRDAKKRIKTELGEGPASYYLSVTGALAGIDTAIRELKQGMPYITCPECEGKKCKSCKQKGYISKPVHDAWMAQQAGGTEPANMEEPAAAE